MLLLTLVVCGVSQHGQPQCGELELARSPLAFGPCQLLPPGSRLFFNQHVVVSPSSACRMQTPLHLSILVLYILSEPQILVLRP